MAGSENDAAIDDALQGLRNGDFTRLDPLFQGTHESRPRIVEWIEQGRFEGHDLELAEALSCACFNGRTEVAEYLIGRGLAPAGGSATGMDAIHWAADRGQLEAVRLLIQHKVSLESRNRYGGTALGAAIWSALHGLRADHLAIIEALLAAGARVREVRYPTGNGDIDAILKRFGAS